MRLFKKIILIVLFLIIVFVANVFISTGYFRTIEHKFDGEIVKKIELPGAEDITVSLKDSFAIVSSTDRGNYPPKKEQLGGLYFMELKSGKFNLKHLTSSLTKSFAPHGISMKRKDSTYKIMAINHTTQGHSIEVFTLNGEKLTLEKSLTDASMISPNDVVMIDENHFYFTNDHGNTKGLGRFLEDYAGLSRSNVVYFDGENYFEVASGIAYANGINFDPKRNLIFVASTRKFLIKVYSRNNDGTLEFIEDINCGTGVDNIEFDTEGNLWVGAHPNLLRFAAYAKGKEKTSPSEIIKIDYRNKNDYSVETVYMEDGSEMSASTVAAPFGNLLLTGNVMDNEFLILKKK
ncbi:MAG: SMP-30/gluconolactonase/LRE family protein [Flavobacteriaceae bacterium]|nr:SMP-30/gluconolactonase/LRE family protein [Flavobacteriaceae bacterium]